MSALCPPSPIDGLFELPGLLPAARCARLIAEAEAIGFEAAGVGPGQQHIAAIRNNERIVVRNPPWAAELRERLWAHGLPRIEGETARGFTEYWRFYRYLPGQRFKLHRDGSVEQDGMRSRMTFMLYLNDDCTGGDTRFRAGAGQDLKHTIDIRPETVKGLLFLHALWHEGAPVLDGVKYALRTDVLYA